MDWNRLRAGSRYKWVPDIHSLNGTETEFIHMWKNRYQKFPTWDRSSSLQVFLGKGALKKCIKFTEEHPSWSVISIKMLSLRTRLEELLMKLMRVESSRLV